MVRLLVTALLVTLEEGVKDVMQVLLVILTFQETLARVIFVIQTEVFPHFQTLALDCANVR